MISRLPYGAYGFGAQVQKLSDDLRWARRALRDYKGRRMQDGRPEDTEVIARLEVKIAEAEAAYNRARVEL